MAAQAATTASPQPLRGQRVLVTGGATGIGRELCIAMAARGDQVLACGRRAEPLQALRSEHPAIEIVVCDVAREDDRARLREEIEARLGGLDILINNAGVQSAQSYGDGTLKAAEVEAEIGVNLVAPMLIVDRLLALLRKGREPMIVNITSTLGVTPKANAPGYCASKAGLLAFTRALRMQLAGEAIKVVEVFPPLVDTPMTVGRGLSKMSAARFASELLEALAAGRTTIAIGDAARMLFLARWVPSFAERAMRRVIRPSAGAASVSRR